ncbi:MAG: hypothetical protein CL920_04555 [Deltaproteobacteria bacterium]|nr:hypothetical protein [Deltaproteobacteria bacterium]MBU47949.1 hypothetical protein [Deltaproteobacteria bacterium]
MKKKVNVLTILAILVSMFCVGSAFAGYKVQVVNKSGHNIKIKYARYKVSTWEYCLSFKNKKIKNGKTKGCVIRNVFNTSKHKWSIKYKCNGKNYTKSSSSWTPRSGPSHGMTRFTITACGTHTATTKLYD